MKIITRTLLGLSLPALLLATGSSYAAASLQSVDTAIQSSGKSTLRLHFDSKVGVPKSFIMKQPAGIVLDFANASRGMGKRSVQLNSKSVKGIKVASGVDKLRVMVSLNKLTKYTTSIQGNDVVLTFDDQQQVAQKPRLQKNVAQRQTETQRVAYLKQVKARQVAAQKRAIAQKRAAAQRNAAQRQRDANLQSGPVVRTKSVKQQAVASNYIARPPARTAKYQPTQHKVTHRQAPSRAANLLGPIDFHRTQNGGGRAIIKLPHPATVVESRKLGNTVVITLKNVAARQPKKRIDVTDFATPASYIDIARNGRDVQIKVAANAAFDFNASRNGKDYIVSLKKVVPKAKVNPLVKKNKVYKGKKLSLNFQDIEVRSVLQLLADFTDKNIVVSDSVKGNITLRLKDVPWDQALDIVLESKGLAMRSNGNVIWVARAAELEAKEKRELQSLKRKKELEPLVTEYISINYAKASDIAMLLKSELDASTTEAISRRGHVSVDERTNTIIVRDTASYINDMRNLIQSLDVTLKQVSVESRIVIANDEFSKELGARFGVSNFGSDGAFSGGLASTNSMVNDLVGGGDVAVPALGDRLNINMPATSSKAGKFAFSLLSRDFLLDLELSALQAENKGEVISTPRVVTVDKKKAMIEQGVEIPYLSQTSSGATDVQFKKAVLSLEVTPQITPDEHIIMDLKVNQDSRGKELPGTGVPTINTQEVQTQVVVGNGQTVVLGGIHKEQRSSDVGKVPVLGDLPVIGRVFRTDADKDSKQELLIFVTPKIMK